MGRRPALLSVAAWLPLAALLAIAAGLRLRLLTDWLGYDECQHFLVARSGLGEGFLREFAARAHPPLYYLMLQPFAAVSAEAWWVRLPSLAAGLLAVALGHRLFVRLLGPGPAAWLAALALASAPIFVLLSVEARGYSLCVAFVIASWLAALRLRESGSVAARDHAGLALWLGLALATEFAAIFHTVALLVALCARPLLRLLDARRFADALRMLAPHALVLAGAGLLFAWQHEGRVPEYAHAAAGHYAGSLADPAAIARFVGDRLPRQLGAIVPAPAGLLLLPLLALGSVARATDRPAARATDRPAARATDRPAARATDRPAAREARWFARAALLSVGLVLLAGLAGVFPFGGTPRHASPIYPGVLIAAILVVLAPLRDAPGPRRSPRWAAALLAALLALPGGVALARLEHDPRTRDALAAQVHADRYRAEPAPIVTNPQGRSLVGWWWLSDARPLRRPESGTRLRVFDYDGVPVVEAASVADAVRTAAFYADIASASWLFLPVAPDESADALLREVRAALSRIPGLRIEIAARSPFVRESVVARIARAPSAATAPSHRDAG